MKFASLWAEIAHQNIALRLSVLGLSLVVVSFAVVLAKLSLKDPIVIERSCFGASQESTAKSGSPQTQTKEEINEFIAKAIAMRFDTNAVVKASWFSEDQLKLRKTEQEDLRKKTLQQKVIVDVSTLEVTKDGFRIAVDRLLSVGKVRSAVLVVLELKLETVTRSASNPYGLILTKASASKDSTPKTEDNNHG